MEILTKVSSVLFGLIIGFLVYKTSGKSEIDGMLSILVGLVATAVISNLVEFYLQERRDPQDQCDTYLLSWLKSGSASIQSPI